jgi:protein TonB
MAAHLQETIVVSVPAGATPQRGVAGGVQGGVIGGVPGGVVGGVAGGVVGGVAGGISGGVMGGVRGGVAGGAAFTQRVPGVITRVNPAGVPGIGIVRATIEANGIVSDVQVLRGEGGPGQAAADAVRHWVFESPEQAPVVTILGFNVTSDGGAVDSPPARIGGTIAPPRKIRDVKPVYPTEAGGVGGVQVVESVIDSTGIVRNARSLRIAGSEALMVAAIDAVLRWEFTPLTVNGAATPVLMTVTVNFTVDGSRATVPAGWPTDPVRVGGHIKTPAKVRDVRPVYPPVAEQARVQGVVIVEAVIGPDGRVASTRILRSIPLLDEAALDAVRQWEFTPTFIDGVAVNVIMTLTVNFTLQ